MYKTSNGAEIIEGFDLAIMPGKTVQGLLSIWGVGSACFAGDG